MRKLTSTILSFSLLTVMSAAAVAPALGTIKERFPEASDLAVKMVLGLPPLFIIISSLFFSKICRFAGTRAIALTGTILYVVSGSGAYFVSDMASLLALRAVLGLAVGLVMPLSVGLLAFYFPPEKMSRLMGLSAAMNQIGGVIATLLAGFLAAISWNAAFLVYLLGLAIVLMVALWLPNEHLGSRKSNSGEQDLDERPGFGSILRRFHPSLCGMFLCTMAFFAFVSNFALVAKGTFSTRQTTLIMVWVDVVAASGGFMFGRIMRSAPASVKYFPPLLFLAGFGILAAGPSPALIIFAGSLLGFANGIGIPYMNTVASIKGGRNSATTILPVLSAALFLAQFVCPVLLGALESTVFNGKASATWLAASVVAALYLVQTTATRKLQMLPPAPSDSTNAR